MATKLILLERVESLGNMGDVVTVKPGYARNYLLPQKKALRASKENIAYFEAKKKFLEAESDKKKQAAEKIAKKLDGLKVPLVRQASEGGQLFGSVTSRDIAVEVAKASKEDVTRSMITLNQNYKTLGLFPVEVQLHPEVKVSVTINIARSPDEAETQARTGKALIADAAGPRKAAEPTADELDAQLADALEADALENKKEQDAEEQAEADAEAKKAAEKKPKKAKAKKAEAADEESEGEEAEDEE
jgi:large subunit ribosomal protein L9